MRSCKKRVNSFGKNFLIAPDFSLLGSIQVNLVLRVKPSRHLHRVRLIHSRSSVYSSLIQPAWIICNFEAIRKIAINTISMKPVGQPRKSILKVLVLLLLAMVVVSLLSLLLEFLGS